MNLRERALDGQVAEDGGAASLLVIVWLGVLLTLAGAGGLLLEVYRARAASTTAADLAALAAAGQLLNSEGSACAAASRIATANGAEVSSCTTGSTAAQVTVKVVLDRGPLAGVAISASARSELIPAQSGLVG
ncbi:MAG: Rv3654c family TadE-like protein [Candidatus Nanopelagicales bacterium]